MCRSALRAPALLLLGFALSLPAQQPNSAAASMVWAGINGPPWPITVDLWSDDPGVTSLTLDMGGTPLQPYTITHAPAGLMSPGFPTAFGIVDQDLSGGLDILIDGLFAGAGGFPGALALLGLQGTANWSFPVPFDATLSLPGLQCVVGDPAAAFGLTVGAATALSIAPYPMLCPGAVGGEVTLSDDGSTLFSLTGGSIGFYGTTYTSVYLNSNGNLTFGSGSIDFTPSTSELLGTLPRIAPLWRDLSPNAGGTVRIAEAGGELLASWERVPAFGCPGSMSSICCHIAYPVFPGIGSTIRFEYGVIASCPTAGAMVVGVSPGGGASPVAVDLSAGYTATPLPALTCTGSTNTSESFAVFETFPGEPSLDLGPLSGGPSALQFVPQVTSLMAPFGGTCTTTLRYYQVNPIP